MMLQAGHEDLVAQHRDEYTDATAGLHDTFPTLLHLLGERVPLGVLGTNLLVIQVLGQKFLLGFVLDGGLNRVGRVEVGEGPTGVAVTVEGRVDGWNGRFPVVLRTFAKRYGTDGKKPILLVITSLETSEEE